MTMRTIIASITFWAIFAVVTAPVAAWYGPRLEEKMFPVLQNQAATVTRVGNVLTFTIALDKNRDCRLVEAGYSVIMGPALSARR